MLKQGFGHEIAPVRICSEICARRSSVVRIMKECSTTWLNNSERFLYITLHNFDIKMHYRIKRIEKRDAIVTNIANVRTVIFDEAKSVITGETPLTKNYVLLIDVDYRYSLSKRYQLRTVTSVPT